VISIMTRHEVKRMALWALRGPQPLPLETLYRAGGRNIVMGKLGFWLWDVKCTVAKCKRNLIHKTKNTVVYQVYLSVHFCNYPTAIHEKSGSLMECSLSAASYTYMPYVI
jgi:hypothetical protein